MAKATRPRRPSSSLNRGWPMSVVWLKTGRALANGSAMYRDEDLSQTTAVYRYMSWSNARGLFDGAGLRLASPMRWEDKYEESWCNLLFAPGGGMAGVKAFGQCWTTRYFDEPFWRMYRTCDGTPVVRIKTTVGKLMDVLAAHAERNEGKAFAGRVRYGRTSELDAAAAAVRARVVRSVARVAAEKLLLKRNAFRFEREVRLLWIEPRSAVDERFLKADANAVVDQVMVGPNTSPGRARALKEQLTMLGFPASKILESRAYAVPPGSALAIAP